MALTHKGFPGTVTDVDFARIHSMGPGDATGSTGDWAVSAGTGRQVNIAAGYAFAKGILSHSTAVETLTIPTPTDGRWYLIARRINWSAKTVTLAAIAHATTTTAIPTAPPTTVAPGLNGTPGVAYDHSLAWAWVRSTDTTVVVFDLRRPPVSERGARGDRSVWYMTDLAALRAHPPTSLMVGDLAEVQEGGALFSWTGTVWEQISVAKFASVAARDTAYAKAAGAYRVAGAQSAITTGPAAHLPQYWDVAGWRHLSGRVPLRPASVTGTGVTLNTDGSVSFSGSTSVGLSTVFSSEFRNYELLVNITAATAPADLAIQVGTGTTPLTSNSYVHQVISSFGSTVSSSTSAATSSLQIGRTAALGAFSRATIAMPFQNARAFVTAEAYDTDNFQRRTAGHIVAGAYSSLFLLSPGASITGEIRVYGIAD